MRADVWRLAKGEASRALTILIFLVILAFATTPARARGTWLEMRITKAICGGEVTPVAKADRLARRLDLTDPLTDNCCRTSWPTE